MSTKKRKLTEDGLKPWDPADSPMNRPRTLKEDNPNLYAYLEGVRDGRIDPGFTVACNPLEESGLRPWRKADSPLRRLRHLAEFNPSLANYLRDVDAGRVDPGFTAEVEFKGRKRRLDAHYNWESPGPADA